MKTTNRQKPMGADITPAAGKDTQYSTEPSSFKNRGWLLIKNKLVLASFTSATSAEERALIASACQSHAALVEALEKQQDRLCQLSDSARTEDDIRAFLVASFTENRAALALAKGGAQ